MSDETTDKRRSDKARAMGCKHGVRWTWPCPKPSCNRTLESIRVNEFVRDVVDELVKQARLYNPSDPQHHSIADVAECFRIARTKHFGKGGE